MKNKHEIVKKIEKEEWTSALDKAFEKKVQKLKVDGFREGKCPRNVFEKKFGVESLYDEAIDIIMPNLYKDTIKESKLQPVVQPLVDVVNISKDGVEFKFTIITAPDVKVNKYTNLKVKKENVKVSKEEVDAEINRLRDQYAEIEIKNGKIEKGDTAVIDFEGFKDGVAFEGGKGENYPLEIGSNTFIPGFEDALIGLSDGDTKDIELTFPEDYPSNELKGEKVVFKVTVHEVKTRVLPEINEEFFDDLGLENVNSKEELEKHCKEELENKKRNEIDNKFLDDLLEKVRENTEIELAEEIVHDEIHRMIDTYNQRLQMQGLNINQYLEFTKKTMEDLESELEDEAKKNVSYRYMIEKIAELEKIDPSDSDVDDEINRLAKQYQMTNEELIKAFGSKDVVKYDLKMRRTIEFLKDNN